jgi:hypothetical protein
MKNFIQPITLCTGIILLLVTSCDKHDEQLQNLVINGSSELPKYDSVPPGWTNVQGHWATLEGDSSHHDFGFAQAGKYYFFAGNDTLGILQQDINVSDYAAGIDMHKQQFIFSGYVQSLDQGSNSDQSQIILTGLDSSKSNALYKYDSDTIRSIGKWRPLTDTFIAPVATRFIRVQLIAIRHVGGDNDGYFDNMALTAVPVSSGYNIILIIAIVIICCLCIAFYFIKKKRS